MAYYSRALTDCQRSDNAQGVPNTIQGSITLPKAHTQNFDQLDRSALSSGRRLAELLDSRVYHLPWWRGVPMILLCPVSLEKYWHVSFLENFHSQPSPDNQRFEITMGVKKRSFLMPFILESRCALKRGF